MKVNGNCKMATVGKLSTREKKPLNCFMLWAQEARKQLTLKQPTLDTSAIATRLGDMWQHLPDEEKEPYIKQAKRLSKVHGDKRNGRWRGGTVTSTCRFKNTAPEVRSVAVQCNLGGSSSVETSSDYAIAL